MCSYDMFIAFAIRSQTWRKPQRNYLLPGPVVVSVVVESVGELETLAVVVNFMGLPVLLLT